MRTTISFAVALLACATVPAAESVQSQSSKCPDLNQVEVPTVANKDSIVFVVDLDCDAKPDSIGVVRSRSGGPETAVISLRGAGRRLRLAWLDEDPRPILVGAGDFDGDDHQDLLFAMIGPGVVFFEVIMVGRDRLWFPARAASVSAREWQFINEASDPGDVCATERLPRIVVDEHARALVSIAVRHTDFGNCAGVERKRFRLENGILVTAEATSPPA
jgi:hypothetical protein